MKLRKRIVIKGKDQFGNPKDKVIELSILNQNIDLSSFDTETIIKLMCINLKCNYNCSACILKNKESFIKAMKEIGVYENGKN